MVVGLLVMLFNNTAPGLPMVSAIVNGVFASVKFSKIKIFSVLSVRV